MSTATTDADQLLGYGELATLYGVSAKTLTNYHARSKKRGYPPRLMPRPDEYSYAGLRHHPRWKRSTMDAWMASRPGMGTPMPELTPEQVALMREAAERGDSLRSISRQIGISPPSVRKLLNRQTLGQ